MDRATAMERLLAGNPRERRRAAQFFVRNPAGDDVASLRLAYARETDYWARRTLKRALAEVDRLPGLQESTSVNEVSTSDEIRARAVKEITGNLIHELRPIVGAIRYQAEREIPAFETSKTNKQVDRLRALLDAIESLGVASGDPAIREFDLSRLINDAISTNQLDAEAQVEPAGPEPFIVKGDPSLIEIAFVNGLRNAVEAPANTSSRVRVNWETTDRDYWIAILDQGPGIGRSVLHHFEIGATTKRNHAGMGLHIAQQAMASLGGSVTLENSLSGGARFEMRWPREVI